MEEQAIAIEDLDAAIAHIAANPADRDVLLSGGDPLALPNKHLLPFLAKLAAIEHVRVIRIHSRALSAHPARIDDELLAFVARHKKFWYYAHFNHPDDVNHIAVLAAAARLRHAGVPVLNQSVLLGGVNDAPTIIQDLMISCYENKILPYNLYLLDKVRGAAHFSVSDETIGAIYEMLGRLPGPAQPVFVVVDSNNEKQRVVYNRHIDLMNILAAARRAPA
jgi:KamA family protein